ncbi:hypothetical protein PG991_010389 [Apiospora marii]|uniref:Uncharacterized protein n=1 Tax=Apiospora marii TaxID=335849 RepID=A0ABR1RI96_9PEZI
MAVGAGIMSRWTQGTGSPARFSLELGPASAFKTPLVEAQTVPDISDAPPRTALAKGATSFRAVPALDSLPSIVQSYNEAVAIVRAGTAVAAVWGVRGRRRRWMP